MVPATTWEAVYENARNRGLQTYRSNPDIRVRMIGLMLAPIHIPKVATEYLPAVPYWHDRSGMNVDFIWPGYSAYGFPEGSLSQEVTRFSSTIESLREPITRQFSTRDFARFIRTLKQSVPSWKYSGGPELILMNSTYHPHGDYAELDFDTALAINLDMLERKHPRFGSVHQLFERVFDYCERQGGNDPTWGFQRELSTLRRFGPLSALVVSMLGLNAADLVELGTFVYALAQSI